MKKIQVITTLLLLLSPVAKADNYPVTDTTLQLNGNNVNLNFNLAGAPASQRDVKIMFCDCSHFTEISTVSNADEWYLGIHTSDTTIKALVQAGWFIQSTVSLNAKQFYIVFVK